MINLAIKLGRITFFFSLLSFSSAHMSRAEPISPLLERQLASSYEQMNGLDEPATVWSTNTVSGLSVFEFVGVLVGLGYLNLDEREGERREKVRHTVDYLRQKVFSQRESGLDEFQKRRLLKEIEEEIRQQGQSLETPIVIPLEISGTLSEFKFSQDGNSGSFSACLPTEFIDITTARGAKAFPAISIVWPDSLGLAGGGCREAGGMRYLSFWIWMQSSEFAEAFVSNGREFSISTECRITRDDFVAGRSKGSFACRVDPVVNLRATNEFSFVGLGASDLIGPRPAVEAFLPEFQRIVEMLESGDKSVLVPHFEAHAQRGMEFAMGATINAIWAYSDVKSGTEELQATVCVRGAQNRPAYQACGVWRQ